uniref:Putative secreted protein n=1 Tax=Ixodes ricinus TaxID=34613 RepID=A0A6B0U499_IXORI
MRAALLALRRSDVLLFRLYAVLVCAVLSRAVPSHSPPFCAFAVMVDTSPKYPKKRNGTMKNQKAAARHIQGIFFF